MSLKSNPNKIEVKDNKVEFDGLLFYVLDSHGSLNIEHLMGYDAMIINTRDEDYARLIIKKIRTHHNPEFYLKPVFLMDFKESKDPILNYLHDGLIYSYDQIKDVASTVKQIFFKTTQLDNQLVTSFEGQTMKKVLNYMFTRDKKTLKPHLNMGSNIGYTFPEISVSFDNAEEAQVLDILEWAEHQGLIWPDFLERIYLCNNCNSGFLSYREVCPHCNSSNSKAEDLVHHFPCAYIGPISDYKNDVDNALNCPKCNKALRHIGVDYDKPSIIHHCNDCDQNYQDFNVKAKCVSCAQDLEVSYLIPKSINVYKLTKKGRSAATNGFLATGEEIEDISGTINMHTFKTMLHYELERVKENELQKSSIAIIYFENIFELYNKVGKKAEKDVLTNIVELIRENLKPSEFIAFENSSTIYLGLINTDTEQAEQAMQKISTTIKELIKTNFKDFDAKINFKHRLLNAQTKAEMQLEKLTKEMFD